MPTCGTCGGSGSINIGSTCLGCSGTGEVIIYDRDGNESIEVCPNCEDGLVYLEQRCRTCGGSGHV